MKRYCQLMSLIVCCVALSAKAQDEEAPPANQAVKTLPGKPLEIEQPIQPTNALGEAIAPKSDSLPSETRDPFWPVGYVPPPEKNLETGATQPEPPQWDEAIKMLIINGIMKSGVGYLAVINGQITSENDTVSAAFKGRTYNWRIVKISQKGVQFERLELTQ